MENKARKAAIVLSAVAFALVLTGAGCKKSSTETATTTEKNWTSSTEKGSIPDKAISGKINGKNVTIANVAITKFDGKYDWAFSNQAPSEACGVVTGNDAVNISMKTLQKGTFEKTVSEELPFNDYSSYYYYNQENGTPMSINTNWDAKVVITNIDEAAKKVTGFAKISYDDTKTEISGAFTADLCE
ncbi:MAG: hypothetical protein WC663_00345 [Patescibacteria group bacterium]|jgi:hypothetical protein